MVPNYFGYAILSGWSKNRMGGIMMQSGKWYVHFSLMCDKFMCPGNIPVMSLLRGRNVMLSTGIIWVDAIVLSSNRKEWKHFLASFRGLDRLLMQQTRRLQLGKCYAMEYRERRSINKFMTF